MANAWPQLLLKREITLSRKIEAIVIMMLDDLVHNVIKQNGLHPDRCRPKERV